MSASFIRNALRKVLLRLLGKALRRKHISVEEVRQLNIKTALIVPKFNNLAGMTMTAPVVSGLENQFPGLRINLIVKNEFAALFSDILPERQLIRIDYPFVWSLPGLRRLCRFGNCVRKKYDLVFVVNSDVHHLRQALLAQVARAKCVVGVRLNSSDTAYDAFYSLRVNASGIGPPERKALAVVNNLGEYEESPQVILPLPSRQLRGATERLAQHGMKVSEYILGFQLGSFEDQECWPVGEFAAVARYFHRKADARIIVFGSISEDHKHAFMEKLPFRPLDFSGQSVAETAATIGKCDAIICNDYDFAYLAASQNRPLVWVSSGKGNVTRKPFGEAFVALQGAAGKCSSINRRRVIRCLEKLTKNFPKQSDSITDFDISERAVDDYLDFGDIREITTVRRCNDYVP